MKTLKWFSWIGTNITNITVEKVPKKWKKHSKFLSKKLVNKNSIQTNKQDLQHTMNGPIKDDTNPTYYDKYEVRELILEW